jgi:DNA-binding transcriptional ArsR family regulator
VRGDADIAKVAAVLDPTRSRILMALADGRALPAGVLAAEAGVASSTASVHLGKLVDARFLVVEAHGRHRYYRLSGPPVAELLEALATFAPAEPVRSLRQETRAQALRLARTCYEHLAGRLGVELMSAMIAGGMLEGGDGRFDPGWDVDYRLSPRGERGLRAFGVSLETLPRRRRLVRYCVDWSEQRHHLAGALGAAIADRTLELDWVRRSRIGRALRITDHGHDGLRATFGVELGDAEPGDGD